MKKIVFFSLLIILITGCATVFTGTSQEVTVNSTPQGLVVVRGMDGIIYYEGGVPVTLNLPKKVGYLAEFYVEGYIPQTIPITKEMNVLWFAGNLLCTNVVGMAVDFVSGAMWKLQPEYINMTLRVANANNEQTLYIVFRGVNEQGQMQQISIPMIKESV